MKCILLGLQYWEELGVGRGERGVGGWGEGRTRLGQLQWTPIRGTKCNGWRAVFPSRKGLASYQPLNLGKLAPEGPSHIAIDSSSAR